MTKHTPSAPAPTFHETTFHPITRAGQPWLTAAEIAAAIGYASDDAISRIYRRRKEEFTPAMSETVSLTVSGNLSTEARIFSLRGAHLLGMFARTARAAEFRRWVLDILDTQTAWDVLRVTTRRQPVGSADRLELPPAGEAFDLRQTMLEDLRPPSLPLPAEVQAAINRKAWAMAGSAYELCRDYLARRVAYDCEHGHPERRIDAGKALAVIDAATLDQALVTRHRNQLRTVLRLVEIAADQARDHLDKLRGELQGLA